MRNVWRQIKHCSKWLVCGIKPQLGLSIANKNVIGVINQLRPSEFAAKTVSKFIFFNLFAAFFNLFAAFFNLSVAFLNLFAAFFNLSVALFNLFGEFFNLFAAFSNLSTTFFSLFVAFFSLFISEFTVFYLDLASVHQKRKATLSSLNFPAR